MYTYVHMNDLVKGLFVVLVFFIIFIFIASIANKSPLQVNFSREFLRPAGPALLYSNLINYTSRST